MNRREAYFEGRADETAMTVPVVLSTEHPVDRGGYIEVLSHRPGDVDMSRANPLPMLTLHDHNSLPIGVIENVRLAGSVLRGVARFSERARALFEDVVKGILRGVSIGYNLLDDGTQIGDGMLRFRWRPLEASIVAIGADPNAGFNRGQDMGALRQHAENLISAKAREIAGLSAAAGLRDTRGNDFSLARLLLAHANRRQLDGAELEVCEEAARARNEPMDYQRTYVPLSAINVRTMTTVPGGKGGYLVGVDTLEPVDVLRPWSVVASAGVTMVDGLTGNVMIPKTTTATTGTWISQTSAAASETPPTLGNASLTERTAAAFIKFSIQLLRQGRGAEAYLRAQLLSAIGELFDAAFFAGIGGIQPLGLLQVSGINTVSGTTIAHAGVLSMRRKVLDAGGREANLSWVGTPAVQELLGARERASGGGRFLWDDAGILGKPAYATKNAAANALVAGDFGQAVVGLFGGIRLDVDPTQDFNSAGLVARVLLFCDLAFPQPAAFSVASSIT